MRSRIGRVEKHPSLLHADRILCEVRKLWPKDEGWDGTIECWSNCREQGYHLGVMILDKERLGQAACVFSEGRSCDGSLVMVGGGESQAFDFQTHQPSQATWENREYFYDTDEFMQTWTPEMRGRKYKKAAEYIIKRFREELAKSLKKDREDRKARAAKQKELKAKMIAAATPPTQTGDDMACVDGDICEWAGSAKELDGGQCPECGGSVTEAHVTRSKATA